MASNQGSSDYEYIVFEGGKIIVVNGDQRTEISKEDYDRAHPKHRDAGCTVCEYVKDVDTLLTWNISRETKAEATEEPKFVGFYTMTDWTGHSGFYVFRCKNCHETRVDYPHGYTSAGCLYLKCDSCRQNLVLHPRKNADIYEREKVVAPHPEKSVREEELRKQVEQIEAKGVKVLISGLPSRRTSWFTRMFSSKS